MKLAIFGRHPVPQGGFNGVMSLFEAIEFSRLGYEVAIYIPFYDDNSYASFLEHHKIKSLDELERFGGRFDIVPVFPDGRNFANADVIVYQSYSHRDWELFHRLCRSRGKLLTKNFPKFVASADHLSDTHVEAQFSQFDLVACALYEDYSLIRSNPDFFSKHGASVAYVPRGACPVLLHPGYKRGLPPTIGMDVPNQPDPRALAHYAEAIERLRKELPELRILSVGRALDEFQSVMVPFGRFDRIYEQFFNMCHLYCTINYEFSPDHLKARVQAESSGWSRKAIYELQNIEAQMSGCAVIGHRSNIIDELYLPGETGFNFTAFNDANGIYQLLRSLLADRTDVSRRARRFAVERFKWSECINKWHIAILDKVKEVNRTTFGGGVRFDDTSGLHGRRVSIKEALSHRIDATASNELFLKTISFRETPLISQESKNLFKEMKLKQSAFSMGAQGIQALIELFLQYKPQSYLEFGSGISTEVAIHFHERFGYPEKIVSIEQDEEYANKTRARLVGNETERAPRIHPTNITIINASVGQVDVHGEVLNGYDSHRLSERLREAGCDGMLFDLALVDGPSGGGRSRLTSMMQARAMLRPGAICILHDALRDEELKILRALTRMDVFSAEEIWAVDRGIFVGKFHESGNSPIMSEEEVAVLRNIRFH